MHFDISNEGEGAATTVPTESAHGITSGTIFWIEMYNF